MRHKLAIDRLQSLAVDRDVFAAGVLQDIRNVESTIVALCEAARDKAQKDVVGNREAILRDMERLSQHGARLGQYAASVIQGVRETSQGPKLVPQDLTALLEWVREVLSDEGRSDPCLTIRVDSPLAPVLGDENYLRLVLMNVVQNSVKFARPNGAPIVMVSQEEGRPDERGRPTLITRLCDNGRGIPEEDLDRIFRAFERGEGKGDGFGLGLSMVAKAMSGMGGKVWAERPAEGEGAIIAFSLPRG